MLWCETSSELSERRDELLPIDDRLRRGTRDPLQVGRQFRHGS
jgi:hypothetical protein